MLLLVAGGGCAPLEEEPDPAAPEQSVESLYAPHFADGRYFNPWPPEDERSWTRAVRWLFTRSRYDKSSPQVAQVQNDGASLQRTAEQPEVTWVGHASFAIHEGDDVVLTDPHFSKRALLPARHTQPGLPVEAIPDDALGVVSHNHYDHLDADSVEALPQGMRWFVPLGLGEFFRSRGRQVVELDWWQSATQGRWTLTCLPSQHWSLRIGQAANSTLWCSWLISGTRRYYFAGDTGYFHGFAEIGRRFAPIDVALLPIGAYEPRWFMRYQHMNPAEAVRAFGDLGARHLIPMHWGAFDLTDEPIDRAPQVLLDEVQRARADPARVSVLAIGETWPVPQ